MEIFKIASQQKLRFNYKGVLSTEQLWDLTLDELDALVVSLEAEHNQSGKKSFLVKSTAKDITAKLRFDVALNILNTKNEAAQAAAQAKEDRDHNKKIDSLIAEKKDSSLKDKSIKELEKMRK
jgi:hypothetical protein